MDTETGRIYLPEEFESRKLAQERGERYDDHQPEFERRRSEGKIVEISERVAVQQLLGQDELARRRRRKASKAARKRNRK